MDRHWIDGGAEAQAFIRNTTAFLSRVLQICGDGALWVGVEACDDGNSVDGDGCNAKCEGEAPAGVTGGLGEDTADGTSPERPEPEEPGNLGPVAGCSASGSGGSVGGLVVVGLALAFASRRRRRV